MQARPSARLLEQWIFIYFRRIFTCFKLILIKPSSPNDLNSNIHEPQIININHMLQNYSPVFEYSSKTLHIHETTCQNHKIKAPLTYLLSFN